MKKNIDQKFLYTIFLAVLMLTQLLAMFFCLGKTSIANDDMCQLDVSLAESLPRIMELLLETDNNPPLFTLLASLWARICPYGSGWLKLLSQLFLISATGIMGAYAKHISGYLSGVITAVMCATSTILVYCCGDVFRPYGLLFLTGCITLCAYLHRRNSLENTHSLILYGVAITAMAYTHYFGILTCFALFLFDLYLLLRKKTIWQVILPYFAAGFCYIPWLIPVIMVKLATAGSFWPQVPTLRNIYTNCYSKYFDSAINLLVFIVFMIVLIKNYQKEKKILFQTKINPEACRDNIILPNTSFSFENLALCLWVPFCVTMIDFIYSALINPAGSMWVERYFIVVYPFSFLLIGVSWSYLLQIFIKKWAFTLKQVFPYLIITAFLLLQVYQFFNTCNYVGNRTVQPFEQACDYLYSQNDFFEETTGFLPTFNHQKRAYRYFFTHHGKRQLKDINWLSHPIEDSTELLNCETIYLLEISTELDSETEKLLAENFEQVETFNLFEASEQIENDNLHESSNPYFISKWIRKETKEGAGTLN